MIEGITNWAKTIIMAIIVVSILEMLLPNNKTKKYVKMVMGIFILFNIISPFLKDKHLLKFEECDIEAYSSNTVQNIEINQESMDRRLEELYIQEIEKDITKKIEKKGFSVKKCKVEGKISNDENTTGIKKIKLKVEKINIPENENEQIQEDEIENKIISTIQSVKKIDTKIFKSEDNSNNSSLSKIDIQNLKKFLIEEYEVNERCLEIN